MTAPQRKEVLSRALTLLAAGAGAALLGAWWGARPPQSESIVPVVSPPPPLPPSGFGSTSKLPPRVQAWLEEIEREKHPATQAAAAARLAARLAPEDWPLALLHLDEFSFSLTRSVLEAAIVRRWAKHDPEAAATWGLQHFGVLAAVAAQEWVKSDAASAKVWFDSLTPRQRAAHHLQWAYYLALVKQDRGAAFASMLAHSNDPQFYLGSAAEEKMVALAPEESLALAEKFTNKSHRESIREAVAREYGRRDPSAAVAWAQQQPDADTLLPAVFKQIKEPPARMIPALAELAPEVQKHILAKSWAWWERGDPFPTLEALRSAPETLTKESRQHLITRMMQSMTSHYDIAESVRRLESEWGDFAGLWERRVAAEWSQRDPVAAHAWINQMPDGPIRDQALAAHDEALKKRTNEGGTPRDPSESTLRMLAAADPPFKHDPDTFARTTTRQLNRLENEERRQVWERAAELPAEEGTRVREKLLSFTSMTDPEEAAAWLRLSPDQSPDTVLASRLAANWALEDAPAAARWIVGLPEGEAKQYALWNLVRQWNRIDAPAVERWAKSQPSSTRAVVDQAIANQRPAP